MRKLLYFCFNKVSDFLLHARYKTIYKISLYRKIGTYLPIVRFVKKYQRKNRTIGGLRSIFFNNNKINHFYSFFDLQEYLIQFGGGG